MHTRPYHPLDLVSIGEVMTLANETDTLSRFFRRNTDKYPFSDRRGGRLFLKNLLTGIGTYCFVLETDEFDQDPTQVPAPAVSSDSSGSGGGQVTDATVPPHPTIPSSAAFEPKIVGFIILTRHGKSPVALNWRRQNNTPFPLLSSLDRFLLNLSTNTYHTYLPWVHPTHDISKYNLVAPLLSQPWDQDLFAEAWEIAGLFVHPDWQRRGLGSKLIQWGKERATEERVPLIVGGSAIGGGVYRKEGFEGAGDSGFGEFFDEVEFGGGRMERWVWVPESMGLEEGRRVVERARESQRKWKEDFDEKRRKEKEKVGRT